MNSMRNESHEEWPRTRVLPLGIRPRLFLLIALVLLPMASVLAWTNFQRYNSRLRNELRSEMEIAQGIATTFETYVDGVRQQLFITGRALLDLSPYTEVQAANLLTMTTEHFPTIRHLSWVSSDGKVLSSSIPAEVGLNVSDQLYFQDLRDGQNWVISDLFLGQLTDAPIFVIATAARDEAGVLRGVVVAGIDPNELGALTLSQDRPAQGEFAIFDRQGVLVHFSLERGLTWEDRVRWRENDSLLQEVLANGTAQTGLMMPALMDEEMLSARVPVEGLGWVSGADRPAKVAFAEVRHTMAWDIMLALLITTTAFLLAYYVARTISAPLRRLEHDAQVMGTGEIPPRDDGQAPSEVQSLRNTVATMATTLVLAKKGAEEGSRAKSDFLANMSHELRTPMTVIIGSLEFLQRSASAPEERQLLDLASTSADRLLGIIDDLLDISRIEAGRLKIEERPFDIRECVRKAVDMFAARGKEKGLRLHWEVSPEIPSHVRGDPDRLGQVLINLVGNAVKFTEHGEVTVTVVAFAGEALVFSIRDTGIGIPADKIGLLFQPFTQVDSSLTRQHGGTGLGLAISKELVALMGGSIRLESEEGRGSTFTFTIPFQQAEKLQDFPQPDVAPEWVNRSVRVLLAEDDPMVRDLVEMALKHRGLRVTRAENGRQAVEKWKEEGINLILMDLQMPELDGLEATRQIRELEGMQGRRTFIFALTAHARKEDRERCMEAGMDGFLAKPLRLEELDSLLEKLPRGL